MLNKLQLWILFAFIITSVICVSQSCQNDNIYFNVEDESEDFFFKSRGKKRDGIGWHSRGNKARYFMRESIEFLAERIAKKTYKAKPRLKIAGPRG